MQCGSEIQVLQIQCGSEIQILQIQYSILTNAHCGCDGLVVSQSEIYCPFHFADVVEVLQSAFVIIHWRKVWDSLNLLFPKIKFLEKPQQWWGRCCSGWEPQALLQVPFAPPPFLPVCPGGWNSKILWVENLDMFEDSSLDNPTRDNCSLFSRNSEGNVTARLGSKIKN